MSIASELYDTLNAASGVRAYVGVASSPLTSRIYPEGNVPEDAALPFVAWSIDASERINTLSGISAPIRQTMQINCYSREYDEAQGIADAVYSALEGNGYLLLRVDAYDPTTKTHAVFIDWSFMA